MFWTLAVLFGFQIYFDFSAYSHIAIGVAQMMGIKFPENFNFSYLAEFHQGNFGNGGIFLYLVGLEIMFYLPLIKDEAKK